MQGNGRDSAGVGSGDSKSMAKRLEKGLEKGGEKAREEVIKIFILDNIEEGKSGETIVEKLCRRFSLDAGLALEYYNTYSVNA